MLAPWTLLSGAPSVLTNDKGCFIRKRFHYELHYSLPTYTGSAEMVIFLQYRLPKTKWSWKNMQVGGFRKMCKFAVRTMSTHKNMFNNYLAIQWIYMFSILCFMLINSKQIDQYIDPPIHPPTINPSTTHEYLCTYKCRNNIRCLYTIRQISMNSPINSFNILQPAMYLFVFPTGLSGLFACDINSRLQSSKWYEEQWAIVSHRNHFYPI